MTDKIERAQTQLPAQTKNTGQIGHGAPCKYNKFTMLPVVSAMAKIGATNADMADALDISLRTFTTWCSQFPELREAVHVGKEQRSATASCQEHWVDRSWCAMPHRQ
jgi:hypothetical protein